MSLNCYRCNKEPEDKHLRGLDDQEWLRYKDIGGYCSIFGDTNEWHIILCQECTKDVLGPYIKFEGNS